MDDCRLAWWRRAVAVLWVAGWFVVCVTLEGVAMVLERCGWRQAGQRR